MVARIVLNLRIRADDRGIRIIPYSRNKTQAEGLVSSLAARIAIGKGAFPLVDMDWIALQEQFIVFPFMQAFQVV